ncbi:hypothetical protein BJ170DRAFT_713227 [Xylariales sp. AK1849]|nr:hypothetical protein BJ170DRAFT_713227 [Xylariales sp. AK1849]
MSEARQIVLEEQLHKVASLVAIDADQLDPCEPLVNLGLDSMIMIEFKDWLELSLGADVGMHDVIDAEGLGPLAALVARKSGFVPRGLPEEATKSQKNGTGAINQPAPLTPTGSAQNGTVSSNDIMDGAARLKMETKCTSRFVPNRLPRFPLPDINGMCNASFTGGKAFATPSEFTNTMRVVEDFKRPGDPGRLLYDRAAARAADPEVENWE